MSARGQLLTPVRRQYLVAYGFIAVPILSAIVFLLIPAATSLYWSFTDYNGIQPAQFIGFENYRQLLTEDPVFMRSLRNTAVFAFLGMLIGPALGLATAVMLHQKIRFQAFFRTAYFLPVMTSLIVAATVWRLLYNRNGLLNVIIGAFGAEPISWLSDPQWALLSVVVTSVWQGFGFETVVFLAALQGIPKVLYEAAEIDGAGSWQKFRHVTVPALRRVILFVYVIGLIQSFQVFDQIFVMTGGGPANRTSSVVYYLVGRFTSLRLGYASAISYLLFLIVAVLSFLQWLAFGRKGADSR